MSVQLRYAERGKPLEAAQFNALVDAVRAARLCPGVGYLVNTMPQGQSLTILPQGGTGGAAACPFEVTDATLPAPEPSGQATVRVHVRSGKVHGEYPAGMSEADNYYLTLDEADMPFQAIYCVTVIDPQTGKISTAENSLTIGKYPDYQQNTEDTIFDLIAEVTLANLEAGGFGIAYIANACPVVDPQVYKLLRPCPFRVTDFTTPGSGTVAIKVKGTKVLGRWPDNMADGEDQVIELSTENPWYVVSVAMNLDAAGKILPGEGNLYIDTASEYPQSTESKQFVTIAEVTISTDTEGGYYISYITNNCKIVEPDLLPVGGGNCPFQIPDASDEEGLKIQIAWGMIAGKLPAGMMPDNNPPLIMPVEPPEYVYAHVTWVQADPPDINYPRGYLEIQSIDFVLDSNPKTNTTREAWYPIGHLTASEDHTSLIITNVCAAPNPSVCDLAWDYAL